MKAAHFPIVLLAVAAALLSLAASCTTADPNTPPKPRHVDPDVYLRNAPSSQYVGESEDHAFLRRPDDAIIYTDTADLPASEQAKILSKRITYSGPGSSVKRH